MLNIVHKSAILSIKNERKTTGNLKKPCTLFYYAMYKHNYKQLSAETVEKGTVSGYIF
jgi:hypothetical protein